MTITVFANGCHGYSSDLVQEELEIPCDLWRCSKNQVEKGIKIDGTLTMCNKRMVGRKLLIRKEYLYEILLLLYARGGQGGAQGESAPPPLTNLSLLFGHG